jgi:hypothetical protein
MPDARRTRSSACENKSTQTSHHRFAEHSGIPCAIGFNGLLRGLPGDRAFLPPSPVRLRSNRHRVDISVEISGRHDFAVRLDALVSRTSASIASRTQRFVTIAKRPLCPGNLAEHANGRLSQNRPLLELSP